MQARALFLQKKHYFVPEKEKIFNLKFQISNNLTTFVP